MRVFLFFSVSFIQKRRNINNMLNAGIIRKTEIQKNYMIARDNQNRKAIVVMDNTIKKNQTTMLSANK